MQASTKWALSGPRRLVAVLFVSLFAASTASAETVTFSTEGVFTSTGTNELTVNGIKITFEEVSNITKEPTPGNPAGADLGTFVTLASSTAVSDFTHNFELTLTQHDPLAVPGSGSFTGVVDGTVSVSSGVLTIDLAPNFMTFGDVTYTLRNDPMDINIASAVGVEVRSDVRVLISVVPLPAAAWGGIALFGVLGGAKLHRSRQSSLV